MHKVDIENIPFNALYHSYPPLIIIHASNKMLRHYLQRGWDLTVRFCSEKVSTSIKTRVFRCHLVSNDPNVNREEMMEHLSAWYCISQNISFGLLECMHLVDFAENYAFVVQDEVQGFHWNKSQCTLHPVVLYYKKLNPDSQQLELKSHSLCFKSDDLDHKRRICFCSTMQS